MKKKWLIIIPAIGIILLFICLNITLSSAVDNVKKSFVTVSNGNTLYVGGSGVGNYTKIQDAIDNATVGDTVFVYDDSSPYYENIEISKEITIKGENKETTIIDGTGKGIVVFLSGDGIKLTGFTIQNGGDEYVYYAGIIIGGTDNIVTDNIIKNNKKYGIHIWNQHNTISNNIIKNNKKYGLYYVSTHDWDITLIANTFEEHDSIYINAWSYYNSCEIKNNTANGKPIRCYQNTNNVIVPNDTSQVILVNCHNCIIQNIDSSGLDIGILIIGYSSNNHIYDSIIKDNTWAGIVIEGYEVNNNNISNCTISDNNCGVDIIDAAYNTIYGNNIFRNDLGISITPSSFPIIDSIKPDYQPLFLVYNNILNNNITSNDLGILLDFGYRNNVFHNNVTKNMIGIIIEGNYDGGGENNIYLNNIINNFKGIIIRGIVGGTHGNNIYQNNIMYNWEGIWIGSFNNGPYDNHIYHNNFIKNIKNARDWSTNFWDNGSIGNYWDNYIGLKFPRLFDRNNDGIGDRSYRILPFIIFNKDRFPLMEPYIDVPYFNQNDYWQIPTK